MPDGTADRTGGSGEGTGEGTCSDSSVDRDRTGEVGCRWGSGGRADLSEAGTIEEDTSEADGVSEEGGNVAEDRSADSTGVSEGPIPSGKGEISRRIAAGCSGSEGVIDSGGS